MAIGAVALGSAVATAMLGAMLDVGDRVNQELRSLGANLLVGGTGRAFSLQPLSVEGMTGLNIAGGVTQVTLAAAP